MRVFVVYAKDDPACTRKFFAGDRLIDVEKSATYGVKLGERYGPENVVHEGLHFFDLSEVVAWLNDHAGA